MSHLKIGIMVSLSDYSMAYDMDIDFLELLVFSSDKLRDVEEFIASQDYPLIIHAPEELWSHAPGNLLDLSSPVFPVLRESRRRVKHLTRIASEYGIPVVVHPGGVYPSRLSGIELMPVLRDSLQQLEGKIWLENMPLIYQKGDERWYCHLMTKPEEFADVVDLVDGITLDTSHAYLSGGGNVTITEFLKRWKSRIRHIHLSDAAFPDREGLQLGEGEVDFSFLRSLSSLPVLLEIRGGHLRGGEGFRKALSIVRRIC